MIELFSITRLCPGAAPPETLFPQASYFKVHSSLLTNTVVHIAFSISRGSKVSTYNGDTIYAIRKGFIDSTVWTQLMQSALRKDCY